MHEYLFLNDIYVHRLVYIIGGVIGGRLSYNTGNTEEHDLYDGELVVRVLQLMNFLNSRLEQGGCEKLRFVNA